MNDSKIATTPAKAQDQKLLAKAAEIDEIAKRAQSVFNEQGGGIAQALAVGEAMADLRAALTHDILAPIMSLMNTKLGFDTDRNPNKAKPGQKIEPYPFETVRDCLAEGLLRGFQPVGNEINIIAGGFYPAKNGLKRKCETWPGVTDLAIIIGVPKLLSGGAIVPAKATWAKNGKRDSLECEIPVKFYDNQGADLIIGKAERKLYKRVHDRLSGRITEDAPDLDETLTLTETTSAGSVPSHDKASNVATAEVTKGHTEPGKAPGEQRATPSAADSKSSRLDKPGETGALTQDEIQRRNAKPAGLTPQQQLAKHAMEHGISFDQFKKWAVDYVAHVDSLPTWDELPEAICKLWLKAPEAALWAEVEKAV